MELQPQLVRRPDRIGFTLSEGHRVWFLAPMWLLLFRVWRRQHTPTHADTHTHTQTHSAHTLCHTHTKLRPHSSSHHQHHIVLPKGGPTHCTHLTPLPMCNPGLCQPA